jgi:hypothetical protein
MAKKLTTKKCIIICQEGLVYSSPANVPHIAFGYISRTVKVGVNGMSTNFILKESCISFSQFSVASVTKLRGVGGIDIDYPTSLHQRFIFDKTLQLSESPFMHPLIISTISSDVGQIFHNDDISALQVINNLFRDVVVSPSHKPSPTSREIFQFSLGSSSAFALQPTYESIMFDSFALNSTEEFCIGSNSKIIYSNVDTKNSILEVRAIGTNVGIESEQEETFSMTIDSQQTFTNFPSEIFNIIIGNNKRNFNSSFDSRNTQNIIFERSRTREIIPNGTMFDSRFSLSSFNNSAGLFDTSDRKLRRQSKISQIQIDKGMQSNIVFDIHSPRFVDAKAWSLLAKEIWSVTND